MLETRVSSLRRSFAFSPWGCDSLDRLRYWLQTADAWRVETHGGWTPQGGNVISGSLAHGGSVSWDPKDRVVFGPLPSMALLWLINGGDPNYLRILG